MLVLAVYSWVVFVSVHIGRLLAKVKELVSCGCIIVFLKCVNALIDVLILYF